MSSVLFAASAFTRDGTYGKKWLETAKPPGWEKSLHHQAVLGKPPSVRDLRNNYGHWVSQYISEKLASTTYFSTLPAMKAYYRREHALLNNPSFTAKEHLTQLYTQDVGAVMLLTKGEDDQFYIMIMAAPTITRVRTSSENNDGTIVIDDIVDPAKLPQLQAMNGNPIYLIMASRAHTTRHKSYKTIDDYMTHTHPMVAIPTNKMDAGPVHQFLFLPGKCSAPIGIYFPADIGYNNLLRHVSTLGSAYNPFKIYLEETKDDISQWLHSAHTQSADMETMVVSGSDFFRTLPSELGKHPDHIYDIYGYEVLLTWMMTYLWKIFVDSTATNTTDTLDKKKFEAFLTGCVTQYPQATPIKTASQLPFLLHLFKPDFEWPAPVNTDVFRDELYIPSWIKPGQWKEIRQDAHVEETAQQGTDVPQLPPVMPKPTQPITPPMPEYARNQPMVPSPPREILQTPPQQDVPEPWGGSPRKQHPSSPWVRTHTAWGPQPPAQSPGYPSPFQHHSPAPNTPPIPAANPWVHPGTLATTPAMGSILTRVARDQCSPLLLDIGLLIAHDARPHILYLEDGVKIQGSRAVLPRQPSTHAQQYLFPDKPGKQFVPGAWNLYRCAARINGIDVDNYDTRQFFTMDTLTEIMTVESWQVNPDKPPDPTIPGFHSFTFQSMVNMAFPKGRLPALGYTVYEAQALILLEWQFFRLWDSDSGFRTAAFDASLLGHRLYKLKQLPTMPQIQRLWTQYPRKLSYEFVQTKTRLFSIFHLYISTSKYVTQLYEQAFLSQQSLPIAQSAFHGPQSFSEDDTLYSILEQYDRDFYTTWVSMVNRKDENFWAQPPPDQYFHSVSQGSMPQDQKLAPSSKKRNLEDGPVFTANLPLFQCKVPTDGRPPSQAYYQQLRGIPYPIVDYQGEQYNLCLRSSFGSPWNLCSLEKCRRPPKQKKTPSRVPLKRLHICLGEDVWRNQPQEFWTPVKTWLDRDKVKDLIVPTVELQRLLSP